ncbi:cellular morphogenesis regulator DopA like protein [Teratosphaeria destructans]|uniref:Cellular morphogenesis regulator DopA like protein n=1 Tax=Teratosphaeria destructans TaxID=418781 RepID=A0A9W7SKA9_9PEZI|nr:cellular morphogenesis regulator DopA like protein [Teratosphaeria destructans]
MNTIHMNGRQSVSPASSGRSSPVPHASRRAVEEGLFKADKSLRRYAALVNRALGTWETSPQEWADYIAFLGRLLKAIQAHPKDTPFLPHSDDVASKLAQCLNPALPSGVHQKSLEVYSYIFSTFSGECLASHLHEYLPGLASVLSFASLSVRPGLYDLFETYIVQIPTADLRSALKSLLLGLLPALEEETSEDFERAFAIVESLENKFADADKAAQHDHTRDGFFWQCLFLCIITSRSRRQGALSYLNRRLPKFSNPTDLISNELSPTAEAVITPEPGLLARSFIAGLLDSQALVQRGFLDLLVSHLPLHSPVLRIHTQHQDLDELVSATIQILLRKDMSLNRRVWAWFLGPAPKEPGADNSVSAPTHTRSQQSSTQYDYFEAFGKEPLQRVILDMLKGVHSSPSQIARPFRICLSLMDRWEIGGSLVPYIFLPALQSVHAYSTDASVKDTMEVMRSANLFFDGVEASLIWATFSRTLQAALESSEQILDDLRLLKWMLEHFNLGDDDMIMFHAPMAFILLGSLLCGWHNTQIRSPEIELALSIGESLLKLIPARALQDNGSAIGRDVDGMSDGEVRRMVAMFYRGTEMSQDKPTLPLSRRGLASILLSRYTDITVRAFEQAAVPALRLVVPLYSDLLGKTSEVDGDYTRKLQQEVEAKLRSLSHENSAVSFPVLSSAVNLMTSLLGSGRIMPPEMEGILPLVTEQLWKHLSPSTAKHHVEAVRLIWQVDAMMSTQDTIRVSLLKVLRGEEAILAPEISISEEVARRFAVLWTHSVPAGPTASKLGAFGLARRASATTHATDAAIAERRLEVLAEPLLRAIDTLDNRSSSAHATVARWLAKLPSLDYVFEVLFTRLKALSAAFERECKADESETRRARDMLRGLQYVLNLFKHVLSNASQWSWDTLSTCTFTQGNGDEVNGVVCLAQICAAILSNNQVSVPDVNVNALALLSLLISSPKAADLVPLKLDALLIERLLECLNHGNDAMQASLLDLVPRAVMLESTSRGAEEGFVADQRLSPVTQQPSRVASPRLSGPAPHVRAPSQLLRCLLSGFSSELARLHMDQWLPFLSSILPTFADSIFASLIPLTECICRQLQKTLDELIALTRSDNKAPGISPDTTALGLMEALEMILAKAHGSLDHETAAQEPSERTAHGRGLLSSVTSGVFQSQGPPTRTAQANSRLTVILAFQDSIKVCLKLWSWSTHPSDEASDLTCLATTTYNAQRVRNKTRHLLEQIFSVEPLETLEVLIAHTSSATRQQDAAVAISLLQIMQQSKPKNVVLAMFDALCSRTNVAALPQERQSTQTVDLNAMDVTLFLLQYLQSIEDDATDEIWTDSLAFLRDVLANPLPYRQVLPALLSLVHLLAQKVANTNFGEQRRMRRDLGDIFQKLLAATLTTVPSSFFANTLLDEPPSGEIRAVRSERIWRASSLTAVLTDTVKDLDAILETAERVVNTVNSITTSLIAPVFRNKSFPSNLSQGLLALLLELEKKAPAAKSWKKEVADSFYDPRLFASSFENIEQGWLPVFKQWTLRDRDRMSDLLGRLSPPSSSGIMFGVGASAARLDADRRSQLNLRRLGLLLLGSGEDAWIAHMSDFEEKLVELSAATESSSPSSTIKAELFMLCRAIILSTSAIHLSPLWSTINALLKAALSSLLPGQSMSPVTNLGCLQACRLLDMLIVLAPEEFQLHEWLYVADTIDAVYREGRGTSYALADQIADVLAADGSDDGESMMFATPDSQRTGERRRLLLSSLSVDGGDVKAMTKDDFASAIIRPFLSQLSIHAYEGTYSMKAPDVQDCRECLLKDLIDLSTLVD